MGEAQQITRGGTLETIELRERDRLAPPPLLILLRKRIGAGLARGLTPLNADRAAHEQ
jgi:hypothetical protein